MITYNVAELMQRMETDIRKFGMGTSTNVFIKSITKHGDTYIVTGDGFEVCGGSDLLLSVTPVWPSNAELQAMGLEIENEEMPEEYNYGYRAGYDYAYGYFD